ncbi:MAG: nitroreductase family protein [Anaerocolumna sp.]
MDFYDVVNSRRTIRDFKDETLDTETIKRILSAGLKAPSNDHMRNWEFVVVNDKTVVSKIIKKIPKKVISGGVSDIAFFQAKGSAFGTKIIKFAECICIDMVLYRKYIFSS